VSCSKSEDDLLDPDDKSDPSRALIRQVLGAVAEYERKMIALRLNGGRKRKLRETGYAGGPRPYGWTADGRGGLVPEPDEQAVLAHIQALRHRAVSFADIAVDLYERGIPKAKGDTTWTAMEVHRTLARAVNRWRGPIPADFLAELPTRRGTML
jgi:DNA invertase Pin-like site-specific DNA recombinase